MTAILIAHKDALARAYLRGVVARTHHHCTCREASSFNDVVDALARPPLASLALVDLDLPGMAAEMGLHFLAVQFPRSRLVALYSALKSERIERLTAAGVVACVPKDLSDNALVRALREVLAGRPYSPPGVAAGPSTAEPVAVSASTEQPLTGRQCEVLELLAQGRSNREIARILDIAEGTVKVHVNAAFRVLGVHNRVSAAAAMRQRPSAPQGGADDGGGGRRYRP